MRPKSLFSIVALLIILCARSTYQLPRMLDNLNNENGYDNLKSQEQNNMNSWHVAADEALQGGTTCDPQTISASFIPVCNGGGDTTTCQPLYANAQMGSPNQQQQQQQSQQPLQAQTPQQQQQQDQYPQQQQQHQQQQQQQQQFPQQSQQQQPESDDSEQRSKELRILVQHLYVAQARVQLEATEIHKAQAVATSAQALLEESANHVRTITATLHNAQQEVAAAAIRAQIAQLQLAAHDQLLFAARQDVDSLSSQVVGLQAAEGIVQPKLTVDLHALLEKLRQPLQSYDRPTPVPMIITLPTPAGGSMGMVLSGDGNNNKDLVKQV